MDKPAFPRGAEWRRWDLHVHTPCSELGHEFGSDFDHYAKELFEKAVQKDVAAIGVTDYFTIEGYKRLRDIREDANRLKALIGPETADQARKILLLPNVEMRASVLVDGNRVNFHVIISDEVDPTTIDECFLRNIKFTAASAPGGADESWPLTIGNLEALGKRLKAQHQPYRAHSDVRVGMMNAVVQLEEVTEQLREQPSRFKDKWLVVVPADEDLAKCSWDGQAHLTRKLFIQKAHMLFSASPGTRAWALGQKQGSGEGQFEREFGSRKPCIHGSDAHSFETLFEFAEGRRLWIRANPTFQGLRQLLHEPDARVFIGDLPPSVARVRENATKYMDTLAFERVAPPKPQHQWFSGEVPLNDGLVAIIGNKGSGKSALTDTLGLLGDSSAYGHFSFLERHHFLRPKDMLGNLFTARVRWRSGHEVCRELGGSVDPTRPELVKYIPQNYLEEICSELKEGEDTEFYRELMAVIFSHVGGAQALGKETLPELIGHVTATTEEHISQLMGELADVNAKVAALEERMTPQYRATLEGQLAARKAELKVHDNAKPARVKAPSQDLTQLAIVETAKAELDRLVQEAQELDGKIEGANRELKSFALQTAAAQRLLERVDNLKHTVESFQSESLDDAETLGLDVRALVALRFDAGPILMVRRNAEARRNELESALNPGVDGSLVHRRQALSVKTSAARSKLDEPNRRFEEYRHQLARWQARRGEIEGRGEDPESVRGLENRLAALEQLPAQLATKQEARWQLTRRIFQAKQRLLERYRDLYAPVQGFIDQHPVAQPSGALGFTASIVVSGLVDGMLEMIHQGRKGTFQGDDEGRERLSGLVARSDFSSEDGVCAFLEEVLGDLTHDRRRQDAETISLARQLREGYRPQDAYDFLFALGYLSPRFELRWNSKPLDQLSAGERGILLLVFYLLIDKREVPLIIDQPEENLDNQTVAKVVVPAIMDAKTRRQILIVTHNPNLAVVCDADQVIHGRLDKADGNRVIYTSGSIEDPTITQLIVDVLEGTKPAFDLRDDRYEVLDEPR